MLNKLRLNFADPEHCRLQHHLHIDALLWVHHLIVAILQLPEDLNVFDIQTGQVLENLVLGPRILYIGFPSELVNICRHLFHLLLLLKIVHGVLPHQIIGYM